MISKRNKFAINRVICSLRQVNKLITENKFNHVNYMRML